VKYGILDDTREITSAVSYLMKEGLIDIIGLEYIDSYLAPFYMVMTKEKEYANKMKI
jgi:hypothetical protein